MAVHSEKALSVKQQARDALLKSTEYWEQLNELVGSLDEASLAECGKVAFYQIATAATNLSPTKSAAELRAEMASASDEERKTLEETVGTWRSENSRTVRRRSMSA